VYENRLIQCWLTPHCVIHINMKMHVIYKAARLAEMAPIFPPL
jgi:hypothetical protein